MSYEKTGPGTWERLRGSVAVLFAAVIAIVACLAVVNLSQASAADRELKFNLDRGIINLGTTTGVKIIDPDLDPPDNPSTLTATLADGGAVSAPQSAFTFPVKRITGLETGQAQLPVVDAKIEIAAAGNISGNWDGAAGTGTITVPAKADITVYPAGNPASVAKCRVSGFNLDLATSGVLVDPATDPDTEYPSAAFPTSGDGALVDNWESLPNSTIVSGGLAPIVCPAVNGLVGGEGGIWLQGTAMVGGEVVQTAPTLAPKVTSNPPAETNLTTADFQFTFGEGETQIVNKYQCRLDSSDDSAWTSCDSGSQSYTSLTPGAHKFDVRAGNDIGYGPVGSYSWTVTGGNPPPPGPAKFGALSATPKNKAVKRGKKVTITARVKNVGKSAATGVKICVKAPAKLVQVKKCVSVGKLAAGKTATAKFQVTVKKKARKGSKATLSFTASANGLVKKTAKAAVKVK